jgi:hypothetical protein
LGTSNEQNENTSRASAGSSVCDDAAIAMNGKQADNTTSKKSYGIDVTCPSCDRQAFRKLEALKLIDQEHMIAKKTIAQPPFHTRGIPVPTSHNRLVVSFSLNLEETHTGYLRQNLFCMKCGAEIRRESLQRADFHGRGLC